ncbi:potassium channel family protein [Cerasicoccus maritimus]|uniref:potassium channel family protein n=1 Tax=Cerasicoccus maritimus TaxID=490089 RepID=UPI002852CC7D|nr:potassium channel family protein [Cerasicoccus maritimus]
MIKILFIGCFCMSLCLFAQGAVVLAMIRGIHYWKKRHELGTSFLEKYLVLLVSMACMLFCIFFQAGIWAALFMCLDEFTSWSTAFYYSLVNFATLGYGDIVMSDDWRILGAIEAVNGVMMLGMTTSMLYAVFNHLIIDPMTHAHQGENQ